MVHENITRDCVPTPSLGWTGAERTKIRKLSGDKIDKVRYSDRPAFAGQCMHTAWVSCVFVMTTHISARMRMCYGTTLDRCQRE